MSSRPCSVVRLGYAEPPADREVQIVDVPVQHVELGGHPGNLFEHQHVMGQRVDGAWVLAQTSAGAIGTSRALVVESALANNVTSCPRRTSSSVR